MGVHHGAEWLFTFVGMRSWMKVFTERADGTWRVEARYDAGTLDSDGNPDQYGPDARKPGLQADGNGVRAGGMLHHKGGKIVGGYWKRHRFPYKETPGEITYVDRPGRQTGTFKGKEYVFVNMHFIVILTGTDGGSKMDEELVSGWAPERPKWAHEALNLLK
jgi:hypothetical protein